MTDYQTLRIEAAAKALNDYLAGMPLGYYPYFDGRDNVIKVSSEEDHHRQRQSLLDAVNIVLTTADALEPTADVNDTNAANTEQALNAEDFAVYLERVGSLRGHYDWPKLVLQRDTARDAPHLAKIKRLENQNRRLADLVNCLVENDPDDMAADAVTVYQIWLQEAERYLKEMGFNKTDLSDTAGSEGQRG